MLSNDTSFREFRMWTINPSPLFFQSDTGTMQTFLTHNWCNIVKRKIHWKCNRAMQRNVQDIKKRPSQRPFIFIQMSSSLTEYHPVSARKTERPLWLKIVHFWKDRPLSQDHLVWTWRGCNIQWIFRVKTTSENFTWNEVSREIILKPTTLGTMIHLWTD